MRAPPREGELLGCRVALRGLGGVQRAGGDLAAAEGSYARACAAEPRFAPGRVLLGAVQRARGDIAAAGV